MAVNIQLKDFTENPTPVPADIIYSGNSGDSFNEVKITIEALIAAYPGLLSIGELVTTANEIIYTTAEDTYAAAPITAFGLSVLALAAGVTVPTAGSLATWDANKNLSANNYLSGFTSVASAAGTTILTVASTEYLEITGATTQTVQMPVASTLVAGTPYTIINNSSGAVTVNSSGGNLIRTMDAGTQLNLVLLLNSGTTAASWQSAYLSDSGLLGAVVLNPGAAQTIASFPLYVSAGVSTPELLDANGALILSFTTVASAVNYVGITNQITGGGPNINALGSDSTVPLNIAAKGAAPVNFGSEALTNQYVYFSGTSQVHSSIMNFPVTAVARTYTWPDASGTVGVITTGSWTPVDASGAALSLTATGSYTQIGNVIIASCQVTFPVTVDGSTVIIGGLPVACSGSQSQRGGTVLDSTVATLAYAMTNLSSATFSLYTSVSGAITNATMSSSVNWFQIIYFV